jgi:hypothetical protein
MLGRRLIMGLSKPATGGSGTAVLPVRARCLRVRSIWRRAEEED